MRMCGETKSEMRGGWSRPTTDASLGGNRSTGSQCSLATRSFDLRQCDAPARTLHHVGARKAGNSHCASATPSLHARRTSGVPFSAAYPLTVLAGDRDYAFCGRSTPGSDQGVHGDASRKHRAKAETEARRIQCKVRPWSGLGDADVSAHGQTHCNSRIGGQSSPRYHSARTSLRGRAELRRHVPRKSRAFSQSRACSLSRQMSRQLAVCRSPVPPAGARAHLTGEE